MVKVSVIVPIYNVKEYLKKCLDSLANQTLKDIEVILVDDGSTDGSENICDLYVAKYNNFVCVHKKNSGQSDARNVGLDLAHGDWIGFVDADDFVDLNYYEEMYNCAISNNSDMVCVNRKVFDEYGNMVYKTDFASNCTYGVENPSDYFFDKFFIYTPSVCNKLYKYDIVKNNRFVSTKYIGSEDTLFNFDLINKYGTVSEVIDVYYNSIERKNSTARSYQPLDIIRNYNLLRELDKILIGGETLELQTCVFLFFQQRIWFQINNYSSNPRKDLHDTILIENKDSDYYKFSKRIFFLKYKYWRKMGYRLSGMILIKFGYLLKIINFKHLYKTLIKKFFIK